MRRSGAAILALAVCALVPLAAAPHQAPGAALLTLDEVYRLIRVEEAKLPVPEPTASVTLGTFDASTGQCACVLALTEIINHKPIRIVPTVRVNAVRARLVFNIVRNERRVVRVRGGGGAATALAGRTSVTLNVGRSRHMSWVISSDAGTVRSELNLVRPSIVGAGAFRVEALPVAVVYEPPQPANRDLRNRAEYTASSEVGTALRSSFSSGTGTTTFENGSQLTDGMAKLGGLLEKSSSAEAKVAGKALTAISGLFGRTSQSRESIDVDAHAHALEVRMSRTTTCSTAARTGPGKGDILVWLQDVRLIWLDDGTQTKLAFLGAGAEACKPVSALQSILAKASLNPAQRIVCVPNLRRRTAARPNATCPRSGGLSLETLASLLALDPFVKDGPQAELPSARYEPLPSIIAHEGAPQRKSVAVTLTSEDSKTTGRTIVKVDDMQKAFLSFVGIGPSETTRVTTTLTSQSSTSFRNSNTVESVVEIQGPPPGTDTIKVFYDRLFGTLALKTE